MIKIVVSIYIFINLYNLAQFPVVKTLNTYQNGIKKLELYNHSTIKVI